MSNGLEPRDIESPSISVHTGDGNSEDVNDTFFDMLSLSDVDTEQLDDACDLQLKKAAATEKALKEKIKEYQLALMGQRIEKDCVIEKLRKDKADSNKIIDELQNEIN